jgi:hypothetical protein
MLSPCMSIEWAECEAIAVSHLRNRSSRHWLGDNLHQTQISESVLKVALPWPVLVPISPLLDQTLRSTSIHEGHARIIPLASDPPATKAKPSPRILRHTTALFRSRAYSRLRATDMCYAHLPGLWQQVACTSQRALFILDLCSL